MMNSYETDIDARIANTRADLGDWLGWQIEDIPLSDRWPTILSVLERGITRRSTGVYKSLCIMHNEKTPSFVMRKSGIAVCYGCRNKGTAQELVPRLGAGVQRSVYEKLGLVVPHTLLLEMTSLECLYEQLLHGHLEDEAPYSLLE